MSRSGAVEWQSKKFRPKVRRRNNTQHNFPARYISDNLYKCIPPAGSLVFALPGWSLILQQNGNILYPELSSTKSKQQIDCNCGNFPCQSVSWYRMVSGRNEMQYLGKTNHAERTSHGPNVDKSKFLFGVKGNSAFTLTINNLTKEDTGSYSCFLGGGRYDEVKWDSGVLLLPGGSYAESLQLIRSLCSFIRISITIKINGLHHSATASCLLNMEKKILKNEWQQLDKNNECLRCQVLLFYGNKIALSQKRLSLHLR